MRTSFPLFAFVVLATFLPVYSVPLQARTLSLDGGEVLSAFNHKPTPTPTPLTLPNLPGEGPGILIPNPNRKPKPTFSNPHLGPGPVVIDPQTTSTLNGVAPPTATPDPTDNDPEDDSDDGTYTTSTLSSVDPPTATPDPTDNDPEDDNSSEYNNGGDTSRKTKGCKLPLTESERNSPECKNIKLIVPLASPSDRIPPPSKKTNHQGATSTSDPTTADTPGTPAGDAGSTDSPANSAKDITASVANGLNGLSKSVSKV